jgi:type III secretory pathway component EscT
MTYNNLWIYFLLGLFRLAPIVAVVPFLGAKIIPMSARMGLAIALTTMFLPTEIFYSISINSEQQMNLESMFIILSVKELMIGFFIAMIAGVPFFIAQSSGILIDYMRGSSMLMAQDPTTQTQVSPIGILYNYFLIDLFFRLDGPFLFFDAISDSFRVIPIDGYLNAAFFNLDNSFWKMALEILQQIFTLSIQLSAPALLAILMAEMFLGIANRLAPQVQISFLGMSLKSLLGLILLWAGWLVITTKMGDMSIDWMKNLRTVLYAM